MAFEGVRAYAGVRAPRVDYQCEFYDAVRAGHLEYVKQLVRCDDVDVNELRNEAFRSACRWGQTETIRFLLEWCEPRPGILCRAAPIDVHAGGEYAFCSACAHGHIQTAVLFLSWCNASGRRRPIDIHCHNERPFRETCRAGHTAAAQWLVHMCVSTERAINIHARIDEALREACAGGHTETARWLLALSPSIDVHAANDWAFKTALVRGWTVTPRFLAQCHAVSRLPSPAFLRRHGRRVRCAPQYFVQCQAAFVCYRRLVAALCAALRIRVAFHDMSLAVAGCRQTRQKHFALFWNP